MLIIAHRGASGHAPEHTFAAYDAALRLGCDFLEQDLQMSCDGKLVVLHDETLDRTTSGRGLVADHTAAQLRDLDAGSWFNRAYPTHADVTFASERIPLLDEVLTRYRDVAPFYIETKQPESAPGMEEKLIGLLAEHDLLDDARSGWRVVIQSFSRASLRLVNELAPGVPCVQLIESRTSSADIQSDLEVIATYAVGIGPERGSVDSALVRAAHERGLVVHPYTVNDVDEMRRLTDVGVDGMFTNFPDRLRALRPAEEARGFEAVRRAAEAARRRPASN